MVFPLERLGRMLAPKATGLAQKQKAITELALGSPLAQELPAGHPACHSPFGVLYSHVREARNAAMHEGAYARCLTTHLTQLALVLEDALMTPSKHVGDFMVRNPTCAAMWQPVSFIRQLMLSHSYSSLPVEALAGEPRWQVVTDRDVASFLHGAPDWRDALGTILQDAIQSGSLPLRTPLCCTREMDAPTALQLADSMPLLVVEGGHLLGIVTAFDLL